MLESQLNEIRSSLVEMGYVDPHTFGETQEVLPETATRVSRIEAALKAAEEARRELGAISDFLRYRVVERILEMDRWVGDVRDWDNLRSLVEAILASVDRFKREPGFVAVYADLLAAYLFVLYRCGSEGRESPLMRLILSNIARRKAVDLSPTQLEKEIEQLDDRVTVGIISKRYAVYVLVTRGLKVLFRSEIDYHSHGTAAEGLALQITNQLVRHGVSLGAVTDIVCSGGDLGALPDGIYVLDEQIRDESLKRLEGSSLNRGAPVACALRDLLRHQNAGKPINLSLAGPLSFTTLDPDQMSSFLRVESLELKRMIKGYVKVTPLKSMAALLSETQRIKQDNLNLVVMTLDELFASMARKSGPRIVRELAKQDANESLNKFDFGKIIQALEKEGFQVPEHFRLSSREIGTGVKEICELLMIVDSGRISDGLQQGLRHVVDTYAQKVASVIEMASTGAPSERPHFVVITSMMALDPHFQTLFAKIRNRIENPYTPIMCMDSLEHEYLIANHLFEMYVSPSKGRGRLVFSVERNSLRQAIQVLEASVYDQPIFSFEGMLDRIMGRISEGSLSPGNLVLVGAENEDALAAVAHAKEFGLIRRVVLIGEPREIRDAIERTKIGLDPDSDNDVEVHAIDPLATDFESKKNAVADEFERFLADNRDFIVMKGSLNTADVLRKALSIYKSEDAQDNAPRKIASHTSLFVLPDGRFFALSDAAVNPGFRNPEKLVRVIENQVDVVRKVLDPKITLKVAIITAVEKRTSAIPATNLAAQAEELSDALIDRYGPMVVEGPLSFDLATVPGVAEEKHYQGKIMGDANCLVATDINTANVLYKMLSKTMGSLGLMVDSGSIITAGPGTVPIVLTSRGDTAETKFNSILLGLGYCSPADCAAEVRGGAAAPR